MRNFYTTVDRFESLHNTISNILSGKLDSSISEGWLEDFYVTNRYATTKSIEKYTAEVLMDKIENYRHFTATFIKESSYGIV